MMKISLKKLSFCFLGLVLFFAASEPLIAGEPTEQLKPVLAEVVTILTNADLKGAEKKEPRRQAIMDAAKKGFDFREMSKRVLGRTWNKITDKDKEYFTEIMTKLMENVYIGKLEGYSGKEVVYVDERQKGDRAQVTTLVEHEGQELPVHYIMKLEDDKWMVYDINIEGVSLVKNYREQFKSILRKDKYEGLVKVIEEKNRAFAAEEAAE